MRMWPKREVEAEEFDIPAPADISAILAYSAEGGTVTIPEQGDLTSRVKGIEVREPGEEWAAL